MCRAWGAGLHLLFLWPCQLTVPFQTCAPAQVTLAQKPPVATLPSAPRPSSSGPRGRPCCICRDRLLHSVHRRPAAPASPGSWVDTQAPPPPPTRDVHCNKLPQRTQPSGNFICFCPWHTLIVPFLLGAAKRLADILFTVNR